MNQARLSGPAEAGPGFTHVEEVMGTKVTIDVRDPGLVRPSALPGRGANDDMVAAAIDWLHWVDRTFSRFQSSSVLSRLARGEILLEACPAAVVEVLELARLCQDRTGGAFDPTWRGDGTLDPTGLVKGWAAQGACGVLAAYGSRNHSVNAAGDLWVAGQSGPGRDWAVGIAHPVRPGRLVAVVEGSDLAVATSGPSEQGALVIDPRSGRPATDLASVTVVGPDLARADAFATAGVALGADALGLLGDLDREGWTSLVVFATGRLWTSAHFEGRVVADGLLVE